MSLTIIITWHELSECLQRFGAKGVVLLLRANVWRLPIFESRSMLNNVKGVTCDDLSLRVLIYTSCCCVDSLLRLCFLHNVKLCATHFYRRYHRFLSIRLQLLQISGRFLRLIRWDQYWILALLYLNVYIGTYHLGLVLLILECLLYGTALSLNLISFSLLLFPD